MHIDRGIRSRQLNSYCDKCHSDDNLASSKLDRSIITTKGLARCAEDFVIYRGLPEKIVLEVFLEAEAIAKTVMVELFIDGNSKGVVDLYGSGVVARNDYSSGLIGLSRNSAVLVIYAGNSRFYWGDQFENVAGTGIKYSRMVFFDGSLIYRKPFATQSEDIVKINLKQKENTFYEIDGTNVVRPYGGMFQPKMDLRKIQQTFFNLMFLKTVVVNVVTTSDISEAESNVQMCGVLSSEERLSLGGCIENGVLKISVLDSFQGGKIYKSTNWKRSKEGKLLIEFS